MSRNLIKTGKPIVDAGMHHQVCIALMGLPFESDKVHTPEFYINIGKQICFDSDVADRQHLPEGRQRHHRSQDHLRDRRGPEEDHAAGNAPVDAHPRYRVSTAVACYMAGIDGGVDGVDLSVRPMASGTVQPDVRSMAHALKGTGYSLDMDVAKMGEIENDAQRADEGLRLQPHHHHSGRPRARLPHAGRRHRTQRPHDGQGRHPATSTARCWRSSRWSWRRAAPGPA